MFRLGSQQLSSASKRRLLDIRDSSSDDWDQIPKEFGLSHQSTRLEYHLHQPARTCHEKTLREWTQSGFLCQVLQCKPLQQSLTLILKQYLHNRLYKDQYHYRYRYTQLSWLQWSFQFHCRLGHAKSASCDKSVISVEMTSSLFVKRNVGESPCAERCYDSGRDRGLPLVSLNRRSASWKGHSPNSQL